MSFNISTDPSRPFTELDLPADHTMHVPPLCCAIIPHSIRLLPTAQHTVVLLTRVPGVFAEKHLWVDQGPLVAGDITTAVFNISNRPIKIKRGEVISRLICVETT